jgi:CubicO group peptidase (beta-lactamase class C family)
MLQRFIRYAGLFVLGLGIMFAPFSVHAQGGVSVSAEQVNKAIPEIEKLAQNLVDTGATPGLAIAVVFEDEVVYLKGFGVREAGKPEPVTEDTVFQLASMSKSMASTVAAALVSDGVVTWDTRVSQVDPFFELHDPYPSSEVTIRDLFSHRSGLGGTVGNELVDLGYDRETILHRLRYVEPASSFRSAYSYSNAGISEGAFAAAKPTGKSWEDVSAEKIYAPLGMASTSSRYDDFLSRTNRAAMHIRADGEWAPAVQFDPDELTPAYGVSSNAKDLAEWVRLHLANGNYDGKQLISEEALAQTRLPTILMGTNASGKPTWYGLGWDVSYNEDGTLNLSHAGAFTQGARTGVRLVPEENWGIVVLTNSFPTGLPEGIAATFYDLLHYGQARRDYITAANQFFDAAFGPASYASVLAKYANPPAAPAPALPNSAYLGTYTNDFVGEVEVIEQDGGLAIREGPNKLTFPLKHFDRDLFIYYPYAEIPDFPSGVTFTIGPDQKASQMVIENLNSDGQGTLTRVDTNAAPP